MADLSPSVEKVQRIIGATNSLVAALAEGLLIEGAAVPGLQRQEYRALLALDALERALFAKPVAWNDPSRTAVGACHWPNVMRVGEAIKQIRTLHDLLLDRWNIKESVTRRIPLTLLKGKGANVEGDNLGRVLRVGADWPPAIPRAWTEALVRSARALAEEVKGLESLEGTLPSAGEANQKTPEGRRALARLKALGDALQSPELEPEREKLRAVQAQMKAEWEREFPGEPYPELRDLDDIDYWKELLVRAGLDANTVHAGKWTAAEAWPLIIGHLKKLKEQRELAGFRADIADKASEAVYVDLDQMAAMIHKSKSYLEKRKGRRNNPLPGPDVPGGGGKRDLWLLATVKPWLEQESSLNLEGVRPHRLR